MGADRITLESSMAKYYATEMAQRVVDRGPRQLHRGQWRGAWRGGGAALSEVRALRIYEGATEVQKMIIAREILRGRATRTEAV